MRVFLLLAVFAFATLSTVLTASQPVFAQSSVIISEVRVEGNQRIEADTVRSYLLVTAGAPYDRSRVDRSLKALFNTGLFADVTIR